MADVTYYFGAGASAQALPTYFNFKERLEYFVYIIDSFLSSGESYTGTKELRIELKDLINELEYHGTPDLVVKKYFHLGDDNKVFQLKNLINIFFIFEQTIDHYYGIDDKERNNPISKRYDKRYDSLIARILRPEKGTFQLPSNFKILTWNYDFQFELSAKRYMSGISFQELSNELQSYPRIFSKDKKFQEINIERFSICHLNGIALSLASLMEQNELLEYSLGNSFSYKNTGDGQTGINFNALKVIFDVYEYYRSNYFNFVVEEELNSNIFFGWEMMESDYEPNLDFKIYKAAIEIAQQTDILVVCGYSFPDFNAVIDKKILGAMKGLRKVYIQSPEASKIKGIIQRYLRNEVNGHLPNESLAFESTEDCSQFLVPSEFTEKYKIGKWITNIEF